VAWRRRASSSCAADRYSDSLAAPCGGLAWGIIDDALELNRARWDALAAVHGQDVVYDSEGLVAGRYDLREAEAAAVAQAAPDLRGRDVVHIQCHIGFDTIALARGGARVTGVDFSPVSLAKAADLAERCGVEIEWVQADAVALPDSLRGRFDIAYATIGAICWIEDIGAWMRSAAATLRPGGRVVLVEVHPLYMMIEAGADPLRLDFPYAFDGPRRFDDPGSYADPDANVPVTAEVVYAHSLGEVVNAAIAAGLRIDTLREHLETDLDPRGDMLTQGEDGHYRLEVSGERLPILFTLIATRPA
jgi:SAM-dependent methyltransferase